MKGIKKVEHHIATLETGEVLGEMSFLEKGEGRSATIKALGEVEVLSLSPEDFQRFLRKEREERHADYAEPSQAHQSEA
jgi:CRP-like cAMP-binding protein